jgi:AraC-like DNA-binding protein
MRQAKDSAAFRRNPIGCWIVSSPILVYCAAPRLAGVSCWGRPSPDEVSRALPLFEAMEALPGGIDLVLDASGVEGIDPDALRVLADWSRRRLDELHRWVARRVGVIPAGIDGLVLAGLAPVVGWSAEVELASDVADAMRRLGVAGGAELAAEVTALAEGARATPAVLVSLRALLRAEEGRPSLKQAARALGVSTRSLQRVLAGAGSSFRAEVVDARFAALAHLLVSTEEKVGSLARRLGISEGALTGLVRARTGLSPVEYRLSGRERP